MEGRRGMRGPEDCLRDAQTLFAFLSEPEIPPEKADFVLAMGSQDLNVAGTAARAFHETRADWLVCSGGFGKDTAGVLPQPEGLLYARRCLQAGVPAERLIVEDRAANSGENFRFSRLALEARGIRPATGVIACKPYMAKRARAAGEKQWPEVRWSVFPHHTGFTEYLAQGNDPAEVLSLMVGDLQRLRAYAGSFQVPGEVPDSVWSAYERLAADGYDRYVIRDF